MKKKLSSIFLVFLTALLSACNSSDIPPYPLKLGAYGLEKAVITNLQTKETIEKSFDEILEDNDEPQQWRNLLSLGVGIKENMLKLHFPYWSGYDAYIYDVVIVLGWQQTYG